MTVCGHCRLCGAYGPLTEEHTPPRRAFNDSMIFLRRADTRNGQLSFPERSMYKKGFAQRTLCETCNNRAGRKFADSYVRLTKRVATQLDFAVFGDHLHIMGVEKPAHIVQQVLLQFVTLINEGFVTVNEWLRSSILERQPSLPPDLRLYLFATKTKNVRSTGLVAAYLSEAKRHDIFAEFAFWPLGCVLAFSDLDTRFLTPIHHWTDVSVKSNATRDLVLRINHTENSAALDYRSSAQVVRDQEAYTPLIVEPGALANMQAEWFKRSGSSHSEPSLRYLTPPNTRFVTSK